MKLFVVVSAFIAVASALPASPAVPYKQVEPIPIVKLLNEGVQPDGSYKVAYETANGIAQEEQGQLRKLPNNPDPVYIVQGQVRYTADNGVPIILSYIADENGFQPQGEHLPKAHPIPEAILRSLEYNAAHPEEDVQTPYVKKQSF